MAIVDGEVALDPPSDDAHERDADADAAVLVEDDLLVEDVSIDGMCGVY